MWGCIWTGLGGLGVVYELICLIVFVCNVIPTSSSIRHRQCLIRVCWYTVCVCVEGRWARVWSVCGGLGWYVGM